jgi:peptidoglycan/xylan/chitin deacetylase (PgdA/CDA1 family)
MKGLISFRFITFAGICAGLLCAPALLFAAAGTPISLVNPSFEMSSTTGKLEGWQDFKNSYESTREHGYLGKQSLKLTNTDQVTTRGAYQRIDLHQTSAKPILISGFVRGENISMAPGSIFGASLYAKVHLTDGTVVSLNSLPNSGTFGWRWIGFNTASGFITKTGELSIDKPIDYIYLVPILANASGTAYFDDMSVSEYMPVQGAVTLMFDDGHLSDYSIAKPILDHYKMPAASAIVTSYTDTPSWLSRSQIKELQESGWDIISHTVTHPDLTDIDLTQVEQEFYTAKAQLRGEGFSADHLAFPFGSYSSDVIALAEKYYASVRTFEDGYNPVGAFPYQLRAQKVVASTTVQEVKAWITHAKENKEWLIIVVHAIDGQQKSQYDISPQLFQSVVAAIHDSAIPVITYGQGIEAYAAPHANQLIDVPADTSIKTHGATSQNENHFSWSKYKSLFIAILIALLIVTIGSIISLRQK